MSKSSELALKIMELFEGEGNADVEDVRAVQQIIEMELDNLKAEIAMGGVDPRVSVLKDLRTRAGAALFDGEGAVKMTRGEFIMAWSEQWLTGHATKRGCMFTFMGIPVQRRDLDG